MQCNLSIKENLVLQGIRGTFLVNSLVNSGEAAGGRIDYTPSSFFSFREKYKFFDGEFEHEEVRRCWE